MGNKQSYNVAEANACVTNAKSSSSGVSKIGQSEVASTYDIAAHKINMKEFKDDDGNYVQYEILYRIDPMPDMPFTPSIPEVSTIVEDHEEIEIS
uniref:Uncharacterized protein n=1 Tax=Panagrolaimus sp. PS1159 TaxID=55785 RepID=A0AC35GFG0_9BILA